MPTDTHRDQTGRVKQTPFRFSADTLADLDAITAAVSAETGVPHTRADTLRSLIRRERDRRAKKNPEKSPDRA